MRTIDAYIQRGLSVAVPARIASLILRRLGIEEMRRIGIQDPELERVLYALEQAAREWRNTTTGTARAPALEPETQSTPTGTAGAAIQLGLGRRAIQKAIDEKRLPAVMVDNHWSIAREDIAHYRATHRKH